MKCYRLKTNHNVIKHKVRFVNLSLNSMNILVNILVSFSPSNKILHIFELPTEWAFQITYESNFKELRELRNSQKQRGNPKIKIKQVKRSFIQYFVLFYLFYIHGDLHTSSL